MKIWMILALLMLSGQAYCDYFLNDEEQQELQKHPQVNDFGKGYACLVATQSFIEDNQGLLEEISWETDYVVKNNRLIATVYKTCIKNISDEEKRKFIDAKDKREFSQSSLRLYRDIDLKQILSHPGSKLNEDENIFLKAYHELGALVKKIKRKVLSDGNENKETFHGNGHHSEYESKYQRDKNDSESVSQFTQNWIGIFLLALGVVTYLLYKRETMDEIEVRRPKEHVAHHRKID